MMDAGTMPGPTANGSRVTQAKSSVPTTQAAAVTATLVTGDEPPSPFSMDGISAAMKIAAH
jgi:hypothetical protein